ncbi:GNAT family N-acetyltransferase [Compostibacter hankyongensis]|uniref:Probable N-acetyltransferase 14 n=1 Tax=Compostibacter hankyongensis TaxID=1007089 RepID=A0ABP8FTW5_9BACT
MPLIRLIQHGSQAYREMVQLRDELLRKPLGLHFTPEYLQREATDILIGCFDAPAGEKEGRLIGCCILSPLDTQLMQLRQMAVAASHQGSGIGSSLLTFAESTAAAQGFRILMMHARKTAAPFYEHLGYRIAGDEFTEVGIPHFEMRKIIG